MKEETTTEDTETINEEEVEEAHCPGTRDDEKMEEETINEEEVEEGKHSDKDEMKEEAPTSIRESLNKEKGKLIFDRLVDKWCK